MLDWEGEINIYRDKNKISLSQSDPVKWEDYEYEIDMIISSSIVSSMEVERNHHHSSAQLQAANSSDIF